MTTAALKLNTPVVKFEEHREFSIKAMTILPELLQTREETDDRYVKVYSNLYVNGSPFPPVTLFHDESTDRYLLADGHTRVKAAIKVGERAIGAVIRKGGIEEAMLFGIDRNLSIENIREVTTGDRRHAAALLLRNPKFNGHSDSWIAWKSGVGKDTVRVLRIELEKEGISIPDRVFQFDRAGNPIFNKNGTHKSGKYTKMFRGRPSVVRSCGSSYIFMGGKRIRVGSASDSGEDIDKRINEIVESKAKMLGHLESNGRLQSYLRVRLVPVESVPLSECPIGGLRIGDAAIVPVPDSDSATFMECCFRSLLIKEAAGLNLATVVGSFRGNQNTPKIIPLAERVGVRVLTLEELTKEFSSREDRSD